MIDARSIIVRGPLRSRWLVVALFVAVGPVMVRGQAPEVRVARAVRVERAPKLDGTLDDPLWSKAEPISDFRQREPYETQPATERTEVRVLYTSHEVYFGIACFDSDPRGIVATELRRDLSQALDDYFEILIDSTHDRRNAYVFQINPLGTQVDGLITEERRSESVDFDPGWDGVWASDARITDSGWTATIGIPFSTLNFTQSQDVVWGLNLKRFIRRKNEEDLWSAYYRIFGITKVSEAGELRGIDEIGSGRLFIIKPYVLGGFDSTAGSDARALHTGGFDMKYGLRSNLVANLTVNTDFADTDVDQQLFNLTPYKLFFPEKRQFFLENAGVFDFSTGFNDLLFFSRQIGIDPNSGQVVPIDAGGKITGTLGGVQVGILDVKTRGEGTNPSANYAVVRVKQSLFGNSYIGLMGIDKESSSPSDPYNRTGGVDTRLVFFRNLVLHGYAAATTSPGVHSGNTDFGADLSYNTSWMEFDARHNKIGPNYNPEVGFVERTDAKQDWVDLSLKPRPKIRGVRELDFEGFFSTTLRTRTASCKHKSGRPLSARTSTMAHTPTMTFTMSSSSALRSHSTSTRTSTSLPASIISRAIKSPMAPHRTGGSRSTSSSASARTILAISMKRACAPTTVPRPGSPFPRTSYGTASRSLRATSLWFWPACRPTTRSRES
jgi:hypothetical protein